MPVNLTAPLPSDLHPVPGVKLGITQAGVRKANRRDLTVITLDEGSAVAGVFTKNRFCAAPVQLCRQHLAANTGIRALLINTGNANAGTGADGLARAHQTCASLARLTGLAPQQVLPFSTGVILEQLPIQKIIDGLPAAVSNLKADNWFNAACCAAWTFCSVCRASSRLRSATLTATIRAFRADMTSPQG